MAKSVNDKVHDAVAMRTVEVTRAANGEAAEIVRGIMADADDRILARLAVIDDPSRMTPKQIALLEEKVKNALSAQERKMRRRLKGYVNEISAVELEAMVELMDRVLDPTGVKTRTPTANAAAAKARREPIGGVKMNQSIRRFFEADRRRVIDTLRSGIAAGSTTQQIARSIVGSPGRRNLDGVRQVSRRGLATMVQTISTHAGGQGREAFAAANTDIISEERWVSTLDADTCPVCGALDGRIFPVGQGPQPPAHPNCLPGDALVSAKGITASSERWYDGYLVVISTAGGKEISCTPNHPILTPTGWVEADLFYVGSDIVCSRGDQWMSPGLDVDHQDMPARIEDVAKALGGASEVFATPVPTTAEDFHGDGMDAQIAVIRTNGSLGHDLQASLFEHLQELPLCSIHAAGFLDAKRAFDEILLSAGAAPDSLMRMTDLERALLFGHASPFDGLGLAMTSQRDVALDQEFSDGIAGYAMPEPEALRRVAGEVSTDQVVSVRRTPFRGHVYNLQTVSGYFLANGVPTHNCRCARMPIIPGLRALNVKDKGILPATVRDSFDGKSPKVLTYPEWLKGQSVTLQKDVLGPTRFALWRTGEIQLKGFVNDRGTTRTLKELRSRVPKVFEMAGIDPKKKF